MSQKWRTLTIMTLEIERFLTDALFGGKDNLSEVSLVRFLLVSFQLTEI
jgi:hypothetical protein